METFFISLGIYFATVFIHGAYRVGLDIGRENGIKEANSKMGMMRIGDNMIFGTKPTIEALEHAIDELPKAEFRVPLFAYGGLAVHRPVFIDTACS